MAKKTKKKKGNDNPVIATNRRARHDYTILDTYECGIVLVGTEVKSLREGRASLVDSGIGGAMVMVREAWSMPVTVRMIFTVIPYGGGMVSGQDSFLGIVTYPG